MSPKIVDREERRQAIAWAALPVFAERGLARATVAEVAERAGVGKGTVYEYFESKEALFVGVVDVLMRGFNARVAARPHAEGLEAGLLAFFEQADDEAEAIDGLAPLFLEAGVLSRKPSPLGEAVRGRMAAAYAEFRGAVAAEVARAVARGEARPDASPEDAATAMGALLDGLWMQASIFPELRDPEVGRRAVRLLVRGLAAPTRTEDTR